MSEEQFHWVELEIEGKKERALNRMEAAKYVGLSTTGLDKLNARIPRYQQGTKIERYRLKKDLDAYLQERNTVHRVEE